MLGDYVLGEFVFCGAGNDCKDVLFRSIDPKLTVTFDIGHLIARRTVVFARAGYGKSNLIKFLTAELYRQQPKTEKGLDVGTLIFDPDGEYFWPDTVKNRPGLCDVPHLQDKLVVFTNRAAPSPCYGSWKVGEVKLDIRQLPARDVVGIAISGERQTHQNVLKLKGLSTQNWASLVDLIQTQGLQASDQDIGQFLGYQGAQQIQQNSAEIAAARSNMFGIVRTLHDPNSRVLAGTLEALRLGSIVVIDISLLSSAAGNMLAGLILRRIFAHNQENFTAGARQPIIPAVAAIEEAQSVLGRNLDDSSPFVEWVKEGRKYDLGAILVTQQPGSMSPELLSQADNWFCFHLLSEGDAETLGRYNSHYSQDILAHLIGEPIVGNCFMWSVPHQPFVLPVRVRSFEESYQTYINPEQDAGGLSGTRAQTITTAMSGALDRLKNALIEALKGQGVRFVSIPSGSTAGRESAGIGSGQLYYLIQGVKTPADTQTEEQLKKPLMALIFGEGVVRVLKHANGKDYYCVSKSDWEKVLGKQVRISDA